MLLYTYGYVRIIGYYDITRGKNEEEKKKTNNRI